ncbi:MAG: hypothetical protein A2Y12_14230 [Planctomycetes bacterium GWF2_42_9]|nr:MAG: hypothetical protein A2Y12_14230 [Planctomycetes bacterium GWF2_42_9]
MGLMKKNPLYPVYNIILLYSILFGAILLHDMYRWRFFYKTPGFYISIFLSFLFLYFYTRNNKYAWHTAVCWLFEFFCWKIIKLAIYGPATKGGSGLHTKTDFIIAGLVLWGIMTIYLLSRYKPYIAFIKDLTRHYDE